jgi:hypothetical protein
MLLMLPVCGCSTAPRLFGPLSTEQRDAIAPYLRDSQKMDRRRRALTYV